jgi:hypothetical protein
VTKNYQAIVKSFNAILYVTRPEIVKNSVTFSTTIKKTISIALIVVLHCYFTLDVLRSIKDFNRVADSISIPNYLAVGTLEVLARVQKGKHK